MTGSDASPVPAGRTLAVAAAGTLLVLVVLTVPLATLSATAADVRAGAAGGAVPDSGTARPRAAGRCGKRSRTGSDRGEHPMGTWSGQELAAIGDADELEIAPVRPDGTLRRPTPMWVVPHDGELYVRAAYGTTSAWYQAARARHEGRIRAEGVERDVTVTEIDADDPVNERVDAGYRSKYRRYGVTYVDMMLAPTARAATLKLIPTEHNGA